MGEFGLRWGLVRTIQIIDFIVLIEQSPIKSLKGANHCVLGTFRDVFLFNAFDDIRPNLLIVYQTGRCVFVKQQKINKNIAIPCDGTVSFTFFNEQMFQFFWHLSD